MTRKYTKPAPPAVRPIPTQDAAPDMATSFQALQQMLGEAHQQLHAAKVENLTLRRELARRMEQAPAP